MNDCVCGDEGTRKAYQNKDGLNDLTPTRVWIGRLIFDFALGGMTAILLTTILCSCH
jgi:hypothetical protein